MNKPLFVNPFRPGAGHMPPHLAGRNSEMKEFERFLQQDVVLQNLVLTGLRGVGKTVLLETLKPIAISRNWLWVGTDMSESSSLTEETLALRLLTDVSVVTSSLVHRNIAKQEPGFSAQANLFQERLDFRTLVSIYEGTPGLVSDKLKRVLEVIWERIQAAGQDFNGIVFAYDEAQNLADHAQKDQFPLSLLLDVFQSLQRKSIRMMLVLTGLPTLFPKLVEARTYSERMFHVIFLDRLSNDDSREAILKPIQEKRCPVTFSEASVNLIVDESGGYPYFIQFMCREIYDLFVQQHARGEKPSAPMNEIVRKLDADFFSGRWARATDRQRELLGVVAILETSEEEFTVQEIVEASKKALPKAFSSSHANQMLSALGEAGLIYKNRHGKYSFAVPLLGRFIRRQSPNLPLFSS